MKIGSLVELCGRKFVVVDLVLHGDILYASCEDADVSPEVKQAAADADHPFPVYVFPASQLFVLPDKEKSTESVCPYCGGGCPEEPEDSENLCDGFAGDIDGLVAGSEASGS